MRSAGQRCGERQSARRCRRIIGFQEDGCLFPQRSPRTAQSATTSMRGRSLRGPVWFAIGRGPACGVLQSRHVGGQSYLGRMKLGHKVSLAPHAPKSITGNDTQSECQTQIDGKLCEKIHFKNPSLDRRSIYGPPVGPDVNLPETLNSMRLFNA